MTASSADFVNWTEPVFLEYGDAPDGAPIHKRHPALLSRPQLFLGFPTRFQPKHEQVEPILMTSRDGLNFQRWTEPLIPITAPQDRDGNRSNYMTWGLLQLPGQDRELSVYATEAYYAGPGSRVRRFTFRTDGFVSLHAGAETAEMVTRALRFAGKELAINYRDRRGGQPARRNPGCRRAARAWLCPGGLPGPVGRLDRAGRDLDRTEATCRRLPVRRCDCVSYCKMRTCMRCNSFADRDCFVIEAQGSDSTPSRKVARHAIQPGESKVARGRASPDHVLPFR